MNRKFVPLDFVPADFLSFPMASRCFVMLVAFIFLTITGGCGGSDRKATNTKASTPSIDMLAQIEWGDAFDGPMDPEFLAQYKAANGKGVTSRGWKPSPKVAVDASKAAPAAAPPASVATTPPTPTPTQPPPPVLRGMTGTVVTLNGKSRNVASLTEEEWYEFLRMEAQREWGDKNDGPCPPEFVQRFIAEKYATRQNAMIGSASPAKPQPISTFVPEKPTVNANTVLVPPATNDPTKTPPSATASEQKPVAAKTAQSDLAEPYDKRLEVPDDDALAEATKLVKKLFGDEYEAAKKPDRRPPGDKTKVNTKVVVAQVSFKLRDFGRKMYAESKKPGLDGAGQYVLMRIARDIALQTGDIESAFHITDKMTTDYKIDRPQAFLDIMDKVSHTLRTPQDANLFLERAIAINYSFIQVDDFVSSNKILLLAHNVAKRLGRKDLLIQIANAREDIIEQKKISAEYAEHALRLFQAPDDPNANLALGKYLCFFKFEWRKGIVMLSRGNDETLKGIASDEIDSVDSHVKQADVADRWWDYSDTVTVPLHQIQIRLHAADLYTAALKKMESSLARTLAEKRVALMKKFPRTTPNGPANPILNSTPTTTATVDSKT